MSNFDSCSSAPLPASDVRDLGGAAPEIQEISSKEDLAKFFEIVFKNNSRYSTGDPDQDKIKIADFVDGVLHRAHPDDHFLVIKNKNGDIIATGQVTIMGESAYLGRQSVVESERKKGLGRLLSNKRIEMAKAAGCKRAECSVFSDNPVSLRATLRLGFTVENFDIYDSHEGRPIIGGFHLSKNLGDKNNIDYSKADKKEILLSDLSEVSRLVKPSEGWRGVDCVKIKDGDDNDPGNWKLILAKFE